VKSSFVGLLEAEGGTGGWVGLESILAGALEAKGYRQVGRARVRTCRATGGQEVAKAEMKTRLYRSIRWRKRSSRKHCIRI